MLARLSSWFFVTPRSAADPTAAAIVWEASTTILCLARFLKKSLKMNSPISQPEPNPRWDTGGTPLHMTAVEAGCAGKIGRPLSHKIPENPGRPEAPERVDCSDSLLYYLGVEEVVGSSPAGPTSNPGAVCIFGPCPPYGGCSKMQPQPHRSWRGMSES